MRGPAPSIRGNGLPSKRSHKVTGQLSDVQSYNISRKCQWPQDTNIPSPCRLFAHLPPPVHYAFFPSLLDTGTTDHIPHPFPEHANIFTDFLLPFLSSLCILDAFSSLLSSSCCPSSMLPTSVKSTQPIRPLRRKPPSTTAM